jgi:hypothetical protein
MPESKRITAKTKSKKANMTTLKFVVLGEKGGVGKTWFSLILIELLRLIFGKIPVIIDMDLSTPNIAKIYQKDNYNTWSESRTNVEDSDDDALTKDYSVSVSSDDEDTSKLLSEQIFLGDGESAARMGDRLLKIMDVSPQSITCFPSQSQKGLNDWLDRNGIGKDGNVSDIIFWWVSDGSFESLDLFQTWIETYPSLKCCLVLNRGVNITIWNKYSLHQVNPTLSKKISDKTLKAFFIDAIDVERAIMIDIQSKGVSFQDILENTEEKYNKYFVNRFKIWLHKSFDNIRKTGYVPDNEVAGSPTTEDNKS